MSERLSTIFGPKNLANRLSDMVLLFNVASHRSWKGFVEGYHQPLKRNQP